MKYLHYPLDLEANNIVKVELDKQANVMLLDQSNYKNYRNGKSFKYFGGHAKQSPVTISPPHSGHWHLIIDTGGRSGTVRTNVIVI